MQHTTDAVDPLAGEFEDVHDTPAAAQPADAAATEPAAAEPSTALVVIPATGETIDLARASVEDLALFDQRARDLVDEVADARKLVSDELVDRLDRSAAWTHRVGDPRELGYQLEVKAPSPEAGTEYYPVPALDEALTELLKADAIAEVAAANALRRCVTVTVLVPFGHDVDELRAKLAGATDVRLADVEVDVAAVTADRTPVAGGIKRLLKIPAAKEALDSIRGRLPTPSRRASVKVIKRED